MWEVKFGDNVLWISQILGSNFTRVEGFCICNDILILNLGLTLSLSTSASYFGSMNSSLRPHLKFHNVVRLSYRLDIYSSFATVQENTWPEMFCMLFYSAGKKMFEYHSILLRLDKRVRFGFHDICWDIVEKHSSFAPNFFSGNTACKPGDKVNILLNLFIHSFI